MDRKEYRRRYYEANKERICEYMRGYYKESQRDKEYRQQYRRKWRENNKEHLREYRKQDYVHEYDRKQNREYLENRPELPAFSRAKKHGALPVYYEEEKDKIRKVYEKRMELQKLWNVKLEVDHIVPLEKGGLHEHSNLQILQKSLNKRKAKQMGHFESIKGSRYKFVS